MIAAIIFKMCLKAPEYGVLRLERKSGDGACGA